MVSVSDNDKLERAQEDLESALFMARVVTDNYDAVDHIVRAIFWINNRRYDIEAGRVARLTNRAYEIQKKTNYIRNRRSMQSMSETQRLKESQDLLESALIWAREVEGSHEAVDHIVRAILSISNRRYEIEAGRVARLTNKAYEKQEYFGSVDTIESKETPMYEELQEGGPFHDD